MVKVKVELTSIIHQGGQSETYHRLGAGEIKKSGGQTRIFYLEEGLVPVKILLTRQKMILKRGQARNNFSLLRFEPGEKCSCKYVAAGRRMDLRSVTKRLAFSGESGRGYKLEVEYDLFSGLYLIGNYQVTLLFS